MRILLLLPLLLFTSIVGYAEIPENALHVMPPMNVIYHPVSTRNPEAQKSFDLGLTYIFAFNHDIAFKAFERASTLDPDLAMAYWGMALALGQNVNDDVTPENEIRCYNYIQQALKLSKKVSDWEKAYIEALAVRYTNQPDADLIRLRYLYRDAMKKVMEAYPQDLDAATMYAESILDLNPWKWWTPDKKPKEGTMEAIDVLESVLARNPDHIGANHYYIHAWEESNYPERALMSAHRLERLLSESGHLLHMPCHVFILVGDYESALKTNLKAIEKDREYFRRVGLSQGTYPLHYLSHNLYVLSRIYLFMEDYENAIKTALDLNAFVKPYYDQMPHLENYAKVPLETYLYFSKWKEILAYDLPAHTPAMESYWHFSKAMAYASLGNLATAKDERDQMLQIKQKIPNDAVIAMNPARALIDLAEIILDSTVAHAEGRDEESIQLLKKAVSLQESFNYDEPPSWYIPLKQSLGFALLEHKDYKAAEKAFIQALQEFRRNGRSLSGLFRSLQGQGRVIDAYWVEREMNAALKRN